jgi:hypothetical protein
MGKVEKIQSVLSDVMRNISSGGAGGFRSIWENAVDSDERLHSEAASFRDGKLTVLVDNSVYLQNFMLKREKIRGRINTASPERRVSEICFKIGSVER